MKTAILGGGLTGITLARLLRERGDEVVVLEKEPVYGGLCRSRSESGFTFDIGGSHIIFSRDAPVLGFMNGLLGGNREERKRNTKVFLKGRFVKYPFENGLSDLAPEDIHLCLSEYVRTLIATEKGEIPPPDNFRDWILATFGRGIAELYLIPYNEKIWKYPPEKMSTHWVEGRIPRPPVDDIIRAAVGLETEGYTHQSIFSYPRKGGIEALVRAIARPVEDCIRTGFAVSAVRRRNGRFVIDNGSEEVVADRCISTIPIQILLQSMENVPEHVMDAAGALAYNSLVSVFLGIRGEVPPLSWLYVPELSFGEFNRISFPSNYTREGAPPGHASILAEITFRPGDPVGSWSDAETIRHVSDGLSRMGLLKPEDIVYTAVSRQDYAYVIYDLDYQEHVGIVRTFCREQGIDLVGRFAEFEYLNMDACIRHAWDYAERSG